MSLEIEPVPAPPGLPARQAASAQADDETRDHERLAAALRALARG